MLVEVDEDWSYIPSADDGGGSLHGALVCADPAGDVGWTCTWLCYESSDSLETDDSGCHPTHELLEDGRVRVFDADEDGGTVTTIAAMIARAVERALHRPARPASASTATRTD